MALLKSHWEFDALIKYFAFITNGVQRVVTTISSEKLDAIIGAFDSGIFKVVHLTPKLRHTATLIEMRTPAGWTGQHGASSQ